MALIAAILLVPGMALAAASEGLMPAPWPEGWRGPRLQAWGGSLTLLGLAAIGAGLPLFR
jgi:hypothetical protein